MKNIPAEFFSWPTDAMRLAMILSHWAPAGINWSALKTSGGNIGTIIKSFTKTFHARFPGGYPTAYAISVNPNGSHYASDIRRVLARRGNKAFIKAGLTALDKSAFKPEYKTDAKYKDAVFVELDNKVYLLL